MLLLFHVAINTNAVLVMRNRALSVNLDLIASCVLAGMRGKENKKGG
jgi:hypothetical protein